ncbi:hypothetical protein BLNAU_16317 [Blattamonas nauphoetae]|uniref:Right handed beta helix domain-containing protein n=1 Tax=Blattamonas nauphoetae TaxID=2049346 RepID=A0ABQ9XBW5_9EUKA|nr:hypothetical protein BLNAU_16317 [Blattamonas nauphoetae]
MQTIACSTFPSGVRSERALCQLRDNALWRSANTTFTRSGNTYTNVTSKSFALTTTTAQVVSVDHRYEQCTDKQCVSLNMHGGGIRCSPGANLAVDNCTFEECRAARSSDDVEREGGGIYIASYEDSGGASITRRSVLSNIRFEDCKATATAGCIFFSNVANTTREGIVNGTTMNMPLANGIMFHHLPVWKRILKDKSSFVNCFSTSDFPRINIQQTPLVVDLSAFADGNETLLDIQLPTLGIAVSADAGSDADGCGSTDLNQKCRSIGFAGQNRLADADTSVVVESGRHEETLSFDVGSKAAFLSLIGDAHPVVSFTPQLCEDSFLRLGVGKVSLSYFSFIPCGTANIVKVVGAEKLTVESCQFQNEAGLTLSDLIIEDCSGSDVSSLFVMSSVTPTNPISNSISATNSPISSVDSDTTTVFLSKPNPIVINPSDGLDNLFYWKDTRGCVSLSCLAHRIGKGLTLLISVAAGTSLESLVTQSVTSAGNGGALSMTLSSSALFSITDTSSFTLCTASGKGSKLNLSRPSLVSFLTPNEGAGPLDSIKPTPTTKAAADGILNEFYNFESLSSEGSLLFYWYPFSMVESTMHVHSSGHTHLLCGKEALPCRTLPDSLSKIQSANTLMIDLHVDLPSKLSSLPRALALTTNRSSEPTVMDDGQHEVSHSGLGLTLKSLSIEAVFIASTPRGTMDVGSSTSFVNSKIADHQASLLSIGGGSAAIDHSTPQ